LKKARENPGVRRTAIAILHYLRDHPRAKESARGIAKWWVGEEQEVVEKALALLLDDGVIEKERHLYRVAQMKPLQGASLATEKTLLRKK